MAPNMNPIDFNNEWASEETEKMYLNADDADVFFSCSSESGEKERIPAHKFVLAAISPFFASMLHGPIEHKGDLDVNGVTPAVFKEFLKKFYIRNATESAEHRSEVKKLWQFYIDDHDDDAYLAKRFGNMRLNNNMNRIPSTNQQTSTNSEHQNLKTAEDLRLHDDQTMEFSSCQR